MRYAIGFFQFWWDFIVGDSIALAIGGAAAIGMAYLLAEAGLATAAEVLMPLLIVGTIWASLFRSHA